MRLLLPILALLVSAFVSACTATYPPADPATYKAFEAPYRLDSGDGVRVMVFGQADISNSFTIDQAGKLSLPLIGVVAARGRTTQEIAADIALRLRQGQFVRDPNVTVEVDRYRPFFIMGEVTSAGQYPFVNGMTVQTAVAIAGGFTPRAQRADVDVSRQINGKVITVRLLPTQPVYPGDTINIRERFF